MIGGRRAWVHALLAYAMVGGVIAVSFYFGRLETILDDGIVFAVLGFLAVGSLVTCFQAWRHIRRNEPIRPGSQTGWLPYRIRRWIAGGSDRKSGA